MIERVIVKQFDARFRKGMRVVQRLVLTLLCGVACLSAEGLIPALTDAQIREARKVLRDFRTNPRGPFHRIRWFCKDGTEHPPSPPPCADRGGGVQHASLSAEAMRLEKWNLDVGTVLASGKVDDWIDADRDHHRLKQLVLERYLEEVNGGWIYRRAYSYRGAHQIEDEEKAGRALLIRLLSDPEWLRRRSFLAARVAETVPHGVRNRQVREIRNLAKSIADEDGRFQTLRAKIHSAPGDEDLAAVEAFVAQYAPGEPTKGLLRRLIELLRARRAQQAVTAEAPRIRKLFEGTGAAEESAAFEEAVASGKQRAIYDAGATLTRAILDEMEESREGAHNLAWMDANAIVQETGFTAASRLRPTTRRERLEVSRSAFGYAMGAGLISPRQFGYLEREVGRLLAKESLDPTAYARAVRYLARSVEWCRATANREFGPMSRLYAPVEPLAISLLDHVLRSSIALPLAAQLEELVGDANKAEGVSHRILGRNLSVGIAGLNPGIAAGRLEIFDPVSDSAAGIDRRAIYVVPEMVSDLRPMAGVLTLDSGNSLSHTQLLAANLGIPNATIPSSLLPELRELVGADLVYSVTPRGVVILEEIASLRTELRSVFEQEDGHGTARIVLDTSRVNLDALELIDLRDLRSADSGVTVGPKAANLGELGHRFPDKVPQGFAIPFGVYVAHIRRERESNGRTIEERIVETIGEAERVQERSAPPEEIQSSAYPQLAEIREAIRGIRFSSEFERELVEKLRGDLLADSAVSGVYI